MEIENEKSVCPLCGAKLQREKDPITKGFKSIVCSQNKYNKITKDYEGCDFRFNFRIPIIEHTLTVVQAKSLLKGETLILKGKRVFIDIEDPTQVKAKKSEKIIKYYLKTESLEAEREDF